MRALIVLLCLACASVARGEDTTTGRSQFVARRTGDEGPSRGPDVAPVTVEVFCTYINATCAQLDDVLAKLSARHPTRLRVVYRQFPYNYKDAPLLAQAAFEAHAQGKFLPFHEALYDKGGAAGKRDVEAAATRAGMDLEQLRAALEDARHADAVNADLKKRDVYELRGPMALVWNGRQVNTAVDLEAFEATYDAFYAEAKTRIDAGLPVARVHATLVKEERVSRAAERRQRAPVDSDEGGIDLTSPRVRVDVEGAPARGAEDGTVTVVMFGDFECPFCRNAMAHIKKLEETFPDDVRFVFKHFPVAHHPNARLAAEAAACAARQDKFWPYLETLFKNPRSLKRDNLVKYAGELGLDADRFVRDLDGGRCKSVVDDDLEEGQDLEVAGTPTIFVNGFRVVGQTGAANLRWIVEEELRPGLLRALTDEEEELP